MSCLLVALSGGRLRRVFVGTRALEIPWAPGIRARWEGGGVVCSGDEMGGPWRPGEARILAGVRTSCLRAQESPFGTVVSLEGGFVGVSDAMVRAAHLAVCAALSPEPLLLLGESGTGKDRLARAIHALGGPGRPWGAVNLAAIPRELVEGELFGWVPGAFTGASARRVGAFEASSGGSLLLDEVSEAGPEVQAKLLRSLEEGSILPLGSQRPVPLKTRILAATNRDPARAVAEGRLRLDLLQRLACLVIQIPPLRQRPGDLPVLARALCNGPVPPGLPDARALEVLSRWSWPGNVRELRNLVRRAEMLHGDQALTGPALEESLAIGGLPVLEDRVPVRGERRREILASGLPRSTWYYRRKRGLYVGGDPHLAGPWATPALAEGGAAQSWGREVPGTPGFR